MRWKPINVGWSNRSISCLPCVSGHSLVKILELLLVTRTSVSFANRIQSRDWNIPIRVGQFEIWAACRPWNHRTPFGFRYLCSAKFCFVVLKKHFFECLSPFIMPVWKTDDQHTVLSQPGQCPYARLFYADIVHEPRSHRGQTSTEFWLSNMMTITRFEGVHRLLMIWIILH